MTKIRTFGCVALVIFGGLCALGVLKGKPLVSILFGMLAFLGVVFIVFPLRSRPLYSGWLKIAHSIGRIITTILLAVAYFTVITPAAVAKKIISGSPLPLKPDKKASSYWMSRSEPAQPRERFMKRF